MKTFSPPAPSSGPADAKPAVAAANWGVTPGRWVLMSLYWLPISLFWGAMLGQILPTRVEQFAGEAHKGAYLAVISISGALVGLVVQIVVGPISDACAGRWGRRRPFLFVGTLVALTALIAFSYAHSFVGLVVAFAGIQLFLNVANGPYQALIPDLVPIQRQGAASGIMGVMSLLGEAAGPLLAGLMLAHQVTLFAQNTAIQHVIWIIAGLLLVCMFVTVLAVPDTPHTPASEDRGLRTALRSAYQFEIRSHPHFYWLLISRAVYNLGFYTVTAFLAYYVQDSLHQGAAFHKPLMIIQVLAIGGALVGTLPALRLADKISKKRLIAISTIFSVVAGIAFALTPSLPFATAMAFMFGIGYGMFRAVDWAFACNLLPPGGGAKFMAIWSLSTMLPQLLAPAFGPVADHLNQTLGVGVGYRAAMFMIPLYALLGLALMTRVREKTVALPPAKNL